MADFGKTMQGITLRLKKRNRLVSVDAFSMLATEITLRSPIGDPSLWQSPPPPNYEPGTFINNWFSSVGSESNQSMRGEDTFAKGSLAQIKAIAPLAPGNVIFFSNPTAYAYRLEFDGWSSQAPQGMVRLTAQRWKQIVNKAVKKNRVSR